MVQRRRHRQGLDRERTALSIAHRAQPLKVVGEHAIVFVARVFFDRGYHRRGSDETREVIDVAVGVVAGNPLREPQDVADAQPVPKPPFDLGAVQAGVAIGVEQA